MKNIINYLNDNLEQFFVLVVLLSIIIIGYFLPYKIAFLNFYYLPIMLMGYFMGKKGSVMGSILCILTVTIFALLSPSSFYSGKGNLDLTLNLVTWGSFLLLAGIFVGFLHEKLTDEYEHARKLNLELQESHKELEAANMELQNSNKTLQEKTRETEESKATIEKLKDKVEETLYSTIDSSVAKLLIQGRLRNEKKRISVLFCDLVGFTSYSEEKKPEMVIDDLNKFLSAMESVILTYWGHIDKYLGDGVMCEFGAPNDFDNHSLQAVLAGIKMQEKITKIDLPWHMRIGIGSGSCITGLIGHKRRIYTAIGDVVNVASRLEQICAPQKILIDEETYNKVNGFIDLHRVWSFEKERKRDFELLEKIKVNEERLKDNQEDLELLVETGKIYFEIREVSKAIGYFEKAHRLDPDNADVKLLYAEANFKRDEYEKIEIKGKKDRISVYEVSGIKDIMLDRKWIPEEFYQEYQYVEELIEIPEDVILPVEALDATIGHSKMVAIISYAVADKYGLTEQEKRNILLAGYLQDIGKQIVPNSILNRRGSLLESEIREVEKHPIESVKILKSIGYDSQEILEIVQHHHEKFNGKGYPNGIKGEDIPIGARITSLVDTYDALISWRPYREGWEQKSALAEITKETDNGKFDPQFTSILLQLMPPAQG